MPTTPVPNSLAARDIAYNLHPYTNARRHEANGPLVIARGEGICVYDEEGKEYIDGLAGLWSVGVGFSERRLIDAAIRQMEQLPYSHSFAHRSHEPSIDLSEKLIKMAPAKFSKVFYTNSGSEANDTVVKLVWFYNNGRGRPQKKKIISRQRAYHGITIASGSLTGLPWNHRDFDLPIANILHTACPHYWRYGWDGESEEEFASRMAGQLEEMILREGPDTIAAFIGEPVMGAGGVIVPPRTYWQKVQQVCRKYDVLVIADEVITGFGRTGKPFGCLTYDIKPDILVVSKQITSSYMPLAAILISDDLYQGIADNSAKIGTLGHGFTTSGHPVALAVALENLKVIEERKLMENAATVGVRLQKKLRDFADHPLVGEVRGVGLIAAVEFVADKASKTPFAATVGVAAYVAERAQEHGLLVRNIGDCVAFCPPMITTEAQIDEIAARFAKALADTAIWVKDKVSKSAA